MKESNLVRVGETISTLEVVSFINTPVQYVILNLHGGVVLSVISDMMEIGHGHELGIIKIEPHMQWSDNSKPLIEKFDGGEVNSITLLSSPYSKQASMMRLELGNRECVIASGDAPYSLFFKFGSVERGRSEFILEDYSLII